LIIKESWNTATNAEDRREKIQALSLAKECYSMKLDLLTNATVVNDAIRFVEERSKEERLAASDKEESREPDYDDDKKQVEGEQEKDIGELPEEKKAIDTVNHTF
jgi:hypothetical protein